jgi:hypothetical protein
MKNLRILFVSTTIASLAFVLSELIHDNFLNAQELNTREKYFYSGTVKGPNLSNNNRPSFISQTPTYAYKCPITIEQTNTAPPTANYRASISCTVGTPVSFVLSLYNANVNFPGNRRYIGPNNFTCPLASSCTTPTYSRVIDRTQHLIVFAGANIRGINGVIYTDNSAGYTWRTYNDRGVGYPLIRPTRTDMAVVPFPAPPYSYIENAPRPSGFSDRLERIYMANQWVVPPLPEAHHIKPLSWSGSDDPQTNGVFLGSATHLLFTNWWRNFSNLKLSLI